MNDFALQCDKQTGLDLEKFTLVSYDLPGYGKSDLPPKTSDKYGREISPKIDPTMDYFEGCARLGVKLMAHLGFKTYSVAAWSDGARVACLIAIENPSRVNSLLLWSFLPTNQARSSWALAKTRDISTWDQEALKFYTDVYGEHEFSDKWRKYVDWLVASTEDDEQFDIRPKLNKIKCPTLILHGSQDPIINYQEEIAPLERIINDSSVDQLRGLSHNLHQADPCRFNYVLTNFVLGTGVCC